MVLEESIRAHATSFVEALEAATLRFSGPEDYNGLIGFGSGFRMISGFKGRLRGLGLAGCGCRV